MDEIYKLISHMAPEEALSKITKVMGRLLADLGNDSRERFLRYSEGDKVSSMVHL